MGSVEDAGRWIPIGDTELYVVERGSGYPIIVLHGGPGLDHHEFADYLDPLCDEYRLLLVDQRGQGRSGRSTVDTWTLSQMARDVGLLGRAMNLERYAVLGHSYGAFVALQHAVDVPDRRGETIVSGGLPSSRFLDRIEANLAKFEPVELREQVAASWARETEVSSPEEMEKLTAEQMPFHFRDSRDPRIDDYNRRTSGAVLSPEVLKHFAAQGYGGIEVEDRLRYIRHPVLVLGGRHDRTCSVEASETMATAIPAADLVIFESSGHMTFVEENGPYLDAVRTFLERNAPKSPPGES
jgi:pimeloyl-ACP methyl ester carboxylesterase